MAKSDNGGIHVAAAAAAGATMMATGLPISGLVGLGAVYAGKHLYDAYKAAPSQKEIEGRHRVTSDRQFGKKK